MRPLWVALRIAIAAGGGLVAGLLSYVVLAFTVDKHDTFWNEGDAAVGLFWSTILVVAAGLLALLFPPQRRALLGRIGRVPGWGWRIAASLAGGAAAALLLVQLCYLGGGRYRYCSRGMDGMTGLLAAVALSTMAVLLMVLFRRVARRD